MRVNQTSKLVGMVPRNQTRERDNNSTAELDPSQRISKGIGAGKCGKGHQTHECKLEKDVCYHCGKAGHIGRKCIEKKMGKNSC